MKKEDKKTEEEQELQEMKEEITKKKEEKAMKKKDKKKSSEELEKELEEVRNDYLRLRADFENYRRRKEEELIQTRERALVGFISELLPIIDNFEMSLKMKEHTEMFVKGTEMLHQSLLEKLKENKVEPFEAEISQEFNSQEHEPVPVDEGEEGKVLGVLSKGYKHKDKVIKAARVQVRKGSE